MSAAAKLITKLENQYALTRTAEPSTWKAGGTGGPDVEFPAVLLSSMRMARSSSTESSCWRLLEDSTTKVVKTAENSAA